MAGSLAPKKDWLGAARRGDRYLDALERNGWDSYFSGEMPPTIPEGWLTPETAPQISSRVRFLKTTTTFGGTMTNEGELAIVSELRFTPAGSVHALVRTVDGRKRRIMAIGEIGPA